MIQAYYDLHLHSCLSPCGDEDMTVNNLLHMAQLKELDLIALTDHNTCQNCPALLQAAKGSRLTVLPGMELTCAEEVHVVCLFPVLDAAMAFSDYVYAHLPPIPNAPEIFGEQHILDSEDHVIGELEKLLVNATDIPIFDLPELLHGYGGICFPAHIDRNSYSILSNLGMIPPECGFRVLEVAQPEHFFAAGNHSGLQNGYTIFVDSDAHDLATISEREHMLALTSINFEGLAEYFQ
ncbi:MAG: PHP domain-containing protein [Anaerotruncus sp.]|jgi:hypothetical protein|nr:PHP domain-containing protein [Anaerotruncus sp.]